MRCSEVAGPGLSDGGSAKDGRSLIEDGGLPGRNCTLGLVKGDVQARTARAQRCRHQHCLMSQPDVGPGPYRRRARNPVRSLRTQPDRQQIVLFADDDAVGDGLDVDDVPSSTEGSQATSLADSEIHDSFMPAEDTARSVDDVTSSARYSLAKESTVVVPRHEADLFTVRLVGDWKLQLPRGRAHLRLRQLAEREE